MNLLFADIDPARQRSLSEVLHDDELKFMEDFFDTTFFDPRAPDTITETEPMDLLKKLPAVRQTSPNFGLRNENGTGRIISPWISAQVGNLDHLVEADATEQPPGSHPGGFQDALTQQAFLIQQQQQRTFNAHLQQAHQRMQHKQQQSHKLNARVGLQTKAEKVALHGTEFSPEDGKYYINIEKHEHALEANPAHQGASNSRYQNSHVREEAFSVFDSPSNPFLPPREVSRSSQGSTNSDMINAPVSTTPSRLINNELLPSPKSIYSDWNLENRISESPPPIPLKYLLERDRIQEITNRSNRLMSQTSPEAKSMIRMGLEQQLGPEQLQRYRTQGIDPMDIYFRIQAQGQLTLETQARVQVHAHAQLALPEHQQQQPQDIPTTALPIQQQTSMKPSPLRRQSQSPISIVENQSFRPTPEYIESLVDLQQQGVIAEEAGHEVVHEGVRD
jgi:hypothetical protein